MRNWRNGWRFNLGAIGIAAFGIWATANGPWQAGVLLLVLAGIVAAIGVGVEAKKLK